MRKGLWLVMVLALLCAPMWSQSKKKDQSPTRSVQGVVTDASESAMQGAVVQLKNAKTLQVRSFITKEQGTYYFHGLSPDVDYELKAEHQGSSSPTKTLSAFDSRKQAVMNLKLEAKK